MKLAAASRLPFCIALAFAVIPLKGFPAPLPVVETPRQPMINTYHGTRVTEDCQWLEDAGSPAVREWSRKQNERSRKYFDGLPYRESIARQLLQLRSQESARYSGLTEKKGRIFALRSKPPAPQPVLVRLSSLESADAFQVVFDPNLYNTNGTTAIELDSSEDGQWFVAKVANGEGGDFAHFVRDAAGKWRQLTHFEDGVKGVRIGRDNALYLAYSPYHRVQGHNPIRAPRFQS